MPLYDYQCQKCGHTFEIKQSIKDDPLTQCPKCKGEIKRLISPAGIVFKGSGFHNTDYRKPAKTENKGPTKEDKTKAETPKKDPKATPTEAPKSS